MERHITEGDIKKYINEILNNAAPDQWIITHVGECSKCHDYVINTLNATVEGFIEGLISFGEQPDLKKYIPHRTSEELQAIGCLMDNMVHERDAPLTESDVVDLKIDLELYPTVSDFLGRSKTFHRKI
jgi:hypothetical protein